MNRYLVKVRGPHVETQYVVDAASRDAAWMLVRDRPPTPTAEYERHGGVFWAALAPEEMNSGT